MAPHLKHCLFGEFRYVGKNSRGWKPTFRHEGTVWGWAVPACPGVVGLSAVDPDAGGPDDEGPAEEGPELSSDDVGTEMILGAGRGAAITGTSGGTVVGMGWGLVLTVPIRRAIW
jgi:hypothetical protein